MSTISQWCRYCGVENRLDAKSCYHCGRILVAHDQRQEEPQQQPKNFTSRQRMMYKSRVKSTMKLRSPRVLWLIAIIGIILTGSVGGWIYLSHQSNQPQNSSNNRWVHLPPGKPG